MPCYGVANDLVNYSQTPSAPTPIELPIPKFLSRILIPILETVASAIRAVRADLDHLDGLIRRFAQERRVASFSTPTGAAENAHVLSHQDVVVTCLFTRHWIHVSKADR